MRDVNKILREAYYTALQATGEKVFYMQAPDDLKGNYYVFQPTTGSPQLMKTGSTVNVAMQVVVYTEGNRYNSGDAADNMAEKVYQRLYPVPSYKLELDPGFQMVSTELQSDSTNSWTLKNQVVAIDRTIVFQHKIFIREGEPVDPGDTGSNTMPVQWSFLSSLPADLSTVTFANSATKTVGADMTIPINGVSSDIRFVLRYPSTAPDYISWYNTPFNNGLVPDSIFNSIVTIGGYKYISTRTNATFNNTDTLIFAT